jgi:hypothetical protein
MEPVNTEIVTPVPKTKRFWSIVAVLYLALLAVWALQSESWKKTEEIRSARRDRVYRILRTQYFMAPSYAFNYAVLAKWDFSGNPTDDRLRKVAPIFDFETSAMSVATRRMETLNWAFFPLLGLFFFLPFLFVLVGGVLWIKRRSFPNGTFKRAGIFILLFSPFLVWIALNERIEKEEDRAVANQVESEINQLYLGLVEISNDLEKLSRDGLFNSQRSLSWLTTTAELRLKIEKLRSEILGWSDVMPNELVRYNQVATRKASIDVLDGLFSMTSEIMDFSKNIKGQELHVANTIARMSQACSALDELLRTAEVPSGDTYYPFEKVALKRYAALDDPKRQSESVFAIFGYRLFKRIKAANEATRNYYTEKTR